MVSSAAANERMNDLFAAALEVQEFFEEQDWNACLIGGLAVIRWGRPRATQDADFSLLTGYGDEPEFIESLCRAISPRDTDSAEFALVSRVYRGVGSNGSEVDIALAALPFEKSMIFRASEFEFLPGCILKTASAEDLVVMKAFAGRRQDWADVENVVFAQWDSLNWSQIFSDLEGLCELAEQFEAVPALQSLKQELKSQL